MNIAHYAKSIAYIAVSLFGVLGAALTDGHITRAELVNIAIVVVGAIGVYWAPNVAGTALTAFKGVVAFLVAGLLALQPFVTIGIVTPADWFQVAIAAFAAIGVIIVPNAPKLIDAGVTGDGAAIVTSVGTVDPSIAAPVPAIDTGATGS